MRASELLASRVIDADGRELGPVRDVRLHDDGGETRITGIVIGGGRFAHTAHALGFAEGRVQGPWLLRRIYAEASEGARVIPAERVLDWGPGTVRVAVGPDDLRPLAEVLP